MKVDAAIPSPMHIRHDSRQAPEQDRFAEILGQVAEQDTDNDEAKVSAAAITPQIGDSAVSFADRPMVLLSAIKFDQAEELFATDSGFFAWGTASLPDAYWLEAMSSFREGIRQVTEQWSNVGRLVTHLSAEKMQALGSAKSLPGPTKQPASQTLPRAVPSQSVAVQTPTSDRTQASESSVSEPEPMPATRNTERSASRGAVLANLFAVENGFRLVLRTPAMRADEQSELIQRLAGLFAEHGRPTPELLIYQPETPDRG